MVGDGFGIPPSLAQRWDEVREDLERTAEAYREDGWETVVLDPGHVALLPERSSRTGIDVLVPDNQFDGFEQVIEEHSAGFDEFTVYREEEKGVVYCLVVAEDHEDGLAVFVPVYYEIRKASDFVEEVDALGKLPIHVHPLSKEKGIVTFEVGDPETMLPER